jgi:hypothetical protein
MMMRMTDVEAHPVDPRDARWEIWNPAYRVDLWKHLGREAWESREFQLSAPDVVSAIEWADTHAIDGETYTLFAVIEWGDAAGLVRLAGQDPTRNEPT